jgi:primosomal replication protein N
VNRLVLTASLVEISTMRYTPAGLPAIDVLLEHVSHLEEAGLERVVKATLKTRALGDLAKTISALPLGSERQFEGFLATPNQTKSVIFHLTQIQPIS